MLVVGPVKDPAVEEGKLDVDEMRMCSRLLGLRLIRSVCSTPSVKLDGKCDGSTLLQNYEEGSWSFSNNREIICQIVKPQGGFDYQEKPTIRLRLAYEGLIGFQ